MNLRRLLIISILVVFCTHFAKANDPEEGSKEFNVGEHLMHHVLDSYDWELTEYKSGEDEHGNAIYSHIAIHLPRILFSSEHGLEFYSSTDALRAAGKYQVDSHGHAHLGSHTEGDDHGPSVYDFSLTKTVVQMFLISFLMLWIFGSMAKRYKKDPNRAPKGIQSLMEPIVIFVKENISDPNLKERSDGFLPYLLSLFFFIWFSNMFGLMPFNSNITGNITVTAALAVLTFVLVNVNGSKDYWKHIFAMPGVPGWLLPLLTVLEILGMFIKPFALTLRLFANIVGGHFMILSLVSLIFILGQNGHLPVAGIASSPIAVLFPAILMLLELLVAFLQSYIFTLLTAVFIGMALESHDHEHEHAH